MTEEPVRRSVAISNEQGLHARPADMIARLATTFAAQITISKGTHQVDAKSILNLLTLGAEAGSQLEIEAKGDDAQQAVAALAELIESGFPEKGPA